MAILHWSRGYHALIMWLITHVSRDWSCTDHVAIMHWSRGYHALITWLIMQWSRCYHALVTWLIMHCSGNWSCTDHVTDHAQITWLIMHRSRDWSCTDHVAIMHWSRDCACTDDVADRALITWLIMHLRVVSSVCMRLQNTGLPYSFPNLEPICCFMSGSNCCFLTCIQVSQDAGKVVWYFHVFKSFPVCCDLYSPKFQHSQWSRARCLHFP